MNSGGAGGGEEVGIVGPAGNYMNMEVKRNTSTRGGTEVDAEVEAFWVHGFF